MNQMVQKIISLSLCLLLLTSCTANVQEGGTKTERTWLTDVYLFRDAQGQLTLGSDRVWKINPIGGTATWCCVDPLCSHASDSDCPLAHANEASSVTAGDWIYTCETGETSQIVSYSLRDGKREVVYRAQKGSHCLPEYGKGQYLWFWEYTIEERGDGSEDYVYSMLRADRESGRVEMLSERALTTHITDSGYIGSPEIIVGEYNDRLYISCEGQLFTTDLRYGDRQKLSERGAYLWNSTFHDGYLYFMSPNLAFSELKPMNNYTVWGNYARESLYRMDCASGEVETLHDNIGGYALVEDTIYYVQAVDEADYFRGDTDTWWDFFEGALYSMSLDGTERTKVCTVPDVNFYCYPSNFVFLGARRDAEGTDHVAMMFFDYLEGSAADMNETQYALSPATLIVNTATGEHVIVPPPENIVNETES